METLRLGVIGCGVIGQYHLRAIAANPRATTVAVADVSPQAVQATAAAFGIDRTYTDPLALIGDPDVDAVILAFPPKGRAELGVAAFQAGKHLLTEKPVARSAAEVQMLLENQGSLVGACCSSRYRFTETARRVSGLLSSGAIGPLRHITIVATDPAAGHQTPPPAWRMSKDVNGGGILMIMGPYDLDFALGLTGWSLTPTWALASITGIPPAISPLLASGSDAETGVTAFLTTAEGVSINYDRREESFGATRHSIEFRGDDGTLQVNMTPSQEWQVLRGAPAAEGAAAYEIEWAGPDDWDDIHYGPVHNFVDAVLDGKEAATDLRRSLVVAQISDALYVSAASGEPTRI